MTDISVGGRTLSVIAAALDSASVYWLSDWLYRWLLSSYEGDASIQVSTRLSFVESLRERGRYDDARELIEEGLLWTRARNDELMALSPRLQAPVGLYLLLEGYAQLLERCQCKVSPEIIQVATRAARAFGVDTALDELSSADAPRVLSQLVREVEPAMTSYLDVVGLMARQPPGDVEVETEIRSFLATQPPAVFQRDLATLRASGGRPF